MSITKAPSIEARARHEATGDRSRRSATAQRLWATLSGFTFAVLIVAATAPLHSATPGLPFTEDFTEDALKDADHTTADWNTTFEQLLLPGSGPATVSLSGTFGESSAASHVGNFRTRAVALGDFNGDGHLDMLEGTSARNHIHFNDGNGDFTLVHTSTESENTRAVAIGDVNGDGSLDFVAANFFGRTRVYLNDGTGQNFVMQPVTSVNRRADSVALADINGNGLLDVVIGTGQDEHVQPNLLILNTGDPVYPFGPQGSQGIPLDETVLEASRGVVVGDVDSDGDLDIVFLNQEVPNRVYLNTPCDAEDPVCFTHEQIDSADASFTRAGALGDLNGNGLLDLVVVNVRTNEGGKIYYNQNNGPDTNPYTAPPQVFMLLAQDDVIVHDVKLADVNNNGLLDIVAVLQNPLQRNRIYFNDQASPGATPSFATFVEIGADPAGGGVDSDILGNEVAIGDLNGNGKLDLVFANEADNELLELSVKYNQVFLNSGVADGSEALQLRARATSIRVDAEVAAIESVRLTAQTTSVGPKFHNDIEFWISSDGGNYWAPIRANGKPIRIASPGQDLRWRAFLRSLSPFEAGALALDELTLSANSLPVAIDDAYGMNQGDVLNVASPGVLANDSDADVEDDLTAVLVQGVSHGTLAFNADGSFTYTPDPAFFGEDSFTYHASDGALSDLATVTIAVNGLPVANDNSYGVELDTTRNVAAPGVLGNDFDPDGDALEAVLESDVTNGTLTLEADGSFSYTPDGGFEGTDSFTYRASDGLASSNVATVTLVVAAPNSPPVAADDSYEVNANTLLSVPLPGVLGNDTDADDDTLTAVLVQGASSGSVTLESDGSFTYLPSFGFSGTATFTYQASDGVDLSDVATVSITVHPPVPGSNNPPVANNDRYSVETSGELVVAAPGVLENDFDPNGDPLTVILVSDVNDGALTLNADGSFTYKPDAGFSGQDPFTYRVTDGELLSNVATVTINVGAANDAPVANDDSYSVGEGTTLDVPAPGVLGNDTDADGDSLTAVLVQGPADGTLSLNANGSFSYTPAAGFTGSDSFRYQANDSLALSNVATVTINVAAGDSGPTFTSTPVTGVTEAQEYAYLITTDDPDGDDVSISALTIPAWLTLTDNGDGTGELRGTPTGAQVGQHPVELLVQKDPAIPGLSSTQDFIVTVTAAEDGPVITLSGAATITITQGGTFNDPGATASDPQDGDLTEAIVVDNPVNTNVVGTYTVTYSVEDTAGNTAQVQRTVIVQAAASTPPPSGGGGGGSGSLGLEVLGLFLLAAVAGFRRRRS